MLIRNTRIILMLLCVVMPLVVDAHDMKQDHQVVGNIALGGNQTKGNTDVSILNGNLDLTYKYHSWVSELTFQGSQTSDAGVITSDYYEAIFKQKYYLVDTVYALVQLGYREDLFGGIYSERSYIGALGYHAFTDEPNYMVDFEVGYGQRITKKVNKIAIDYDLGKHLAVIAEYIFTEKDTIKAQISGEFGNDDDYLKQELHWVHELFNNLNVDFSYEARTLTAPGVGKVKTDTVTALQLGYSF